MTCQWILCQRLKDTSTNLPKLNIFSVCNTIHKKNIVCFNDPKIRWSKAQICVLLLLQAFTVFLRPTN